MAWPGKQYLLLLEIIKLILNILQCFNTRDISTPLQYISISRYQNRPERVLDYLSVKPSLATLFAKSFSFLFVLHQHQHTAGTLA